MTDPVDQLKGTGQLIGDYFNWAKKNLPPVPIINPDPFGAAGLKIGELLKAVGLPETGDSVTRASNIVSGQMSQIASDVISAPTALYTLADLGANWIRPKTLDDVVAGGKDYSKPYLPGAQDAREFTDKVSTIGSAMGERIAGEPVNMQVLKPIKNFSNDPLGNSAQLIGSLGRIAGSLLPAPEAAVAKIGMLGDKISAANKIVGSVVKGTGHALEVVTPITFNPTKVGYAANTAVGAGITTGLEAILGDEPQVQQAVAKTNEEAAQAFQQAKAIKDGEVVKAGMIPLPDWLDSGTAAAAIGGVTVAALLLRRGLKGASDSMKPTAALDAMVSDRLAPLKATLEQIDPQTAKHFDAFSARHGVDGSISTAVEHNFDSGRLPDAQVSQIGPVKPLKITPHREILSLYKGLGDDGPVLDKLMNYATELDNRIVNLIEKYPQLDKYLRIRNPTTGDWDYDYNRLQALIRTTANSNVDEAISVNLSGNQGLPAVSTTDLLKEILAARGNAKVAALEQILKNDYKTLTGYIENLGLRSKDEAELFRKTNINYSPTDRDYGTNLWQRTRAAFSGNDDMGSPIEQRAQYIQSLITQAMKDQTRQYWMHRMTDASNQGNSFAKGLIKRRATEIESFVDSKGKLTVRYKDGKVNEYNANKVVVWRDQFGKQHVDEISDPLVRAAIKQESPFAINQAMYLFDKMRRWQQLTQTGALTVANTMFAPKSALMTALFGAIKKPKDVIGGPLDNYVQYLFNGAVHVPGDITNILNIPQAIIADTLSAISRSIANSMESSVHQNGLMSRMLGQSHAKLLADTFRAKWEDSIRFKMHDLGISHSAPITDHSDYYAGFVKNGVQRLNYLNVPTNIIKQVFSVIDQAHNIVSASPISAMVRKNHERLTPDRLTKVAREYAADPGKRALAPGSYETNLGQGTSSFLHMANATIPYANVTIQSIADFAREAKKNPGRMSAGVAIGVGIPAFLATSYNVGLGPEYVDYQFNKRTAATQAQNLYFGVPGQPPEMGIEYPIDPFYRPFQVLATTLIGGTYGLYDGSIFKPHNDHMKYRMQEMALPRFKQTFAEAGDMSIGMQLPMIAAGPLAMSGNIPGEISPFKPLFRKPQEHRLAGFDDERTSRYVNDNLFGLQIDRRFDETARVVLGTLGEQILASLRTLSGTADAGAPIKEGFQDIAQRETMRLKDGAKIFNGLLWAQSPKLSPYGVESTVLYEKRTGIRTLTEAYNQIQHAGMSGSKTRPGRPLAGAQPAMPTDPEMIFVAQQASQLSRLIDKNYMSRIKSIQDEIVSIESSVKYTPKTQRKMINDLNDQLQTYQAAALQAIQYFEVNLSQKYGRRIDLSKLRLEKGMDQFPPISQ